MCNLKHTKYQPTIEEFNCPKCGAVAGEFAIDPTEDDTGECELLHDTDSLLCYSCDYETYGKKFAAYLMKKNNLVKCECCKGTGYVKRG